MSNKETKPSSPSGGGHITLTVNGLQDGDEVFFRIKRSSGHRLPGEQTPSELEMVGGDEIYANRVGARTAKERGKMSNVETKPLSGGEHITLKVRGQDGNIAFFRIKRSTQLKKLMDLYCEGRQSADHDSLVFHFDGRRLRGEQTSDELEMNEGDEIDVMLNRRGC